MSNIRFDIPTLLKYIGIRGYAPRAAAALNRALSAKDNIEYENAKREAAKEITGYENVNIIEEGSLSFSESSHFEGLPVWMVLELKPYPGQSKELLLDTAIVTINQPRNIIKTAVQGLDNTVKEFISDGDFEVSVTGILASKTHEYPFDQVSLLRSYFKFKGSLKVVHPVLNSIGIYEIVIEEWNLPSSQFTNCAAYSFKAISETPVNLKIK